MLKTVLWIASACAAVLLALAVSRWLQFDAPAEPKPAPQIIEEPVAPPMVVPPPPPLEAAPVRTPEEVQIEEDAAATGMTTVEPEPSPPAN
jgi:hypothetical protein